MGALLHCSQPSLASFPDLANSSLRVLVGPSFISQTTMVSNACHAPEPYNFSTLKQPCKEGNTIPILQI